MKKASALVLVVFSFIYLTQGWLNPTFAEPLLTTKRSSAAIAITQDGKTLVVVNPDSNSVSIVDTNALDKISELPVGRDPRTIAIGDEGRFAYIANHGSGTVSIVDLEHLAIADEAHAGFHPYGIVVSPSAERVYVALQGQDQVGILDKTTLETMALLDTGDRPSGLAISDDGTTLFVTHLLDPTLSIIELAGDAEKDGTSVSLWPDSNLLQSVVLDPTRQLAWLAHTRSNTANRALSFDTTVFPVVTPIDLTMRTITATANIALDTADQPVGLPFDAAFSTDGRQIWIVNAASNDVSVIDRTSRRKLANIKVEDNPRGIVMAPNGGHVYVNNTLAGTVSVIDTSTYSVVTTISVTRIPLPPLLLHGKRLFHTSADTRLSRDRWISCNTCHFDHEHDGRTWFFNFSGPRNTTSLLGMIFTYPLRWSGEWDESADSEFAIRMENFGSGLIPEGMNCTLQPPDCIAGTPNQGRSYDMDALAAFIDSLAPPQSPRQTAGLALTPAAQRGQALFLDANTGCVTCHPPPLYTDHQKHDVGTGTADEKIGTAYDTPTLWGLYDSAPYFHDGSAATLQDTLKRQSSGSEHDVCRHLSDGQCNDLIKFLETLPHQ